MKALLRKLNGSKTLTLDKLRRPVEQSTSALEETLLLANKYWKQLNQIEGRDWPLILNVFDKSTQSDGTIGSEKNLDSGRGKLLFSLLDRSTTK